jgi:hypothetical protein
MIPITDQFKNELKKSISQGLKYRILLDGKDISSRLNIENVGQIDFSLELTFNEFVCGDSFLELWDDDNYIWDYIVAATSDPYLEIYIGFPFEQIKRFGGYLDRDSIEKKAGVITLHVTQFHKKLEGELTKNVDWSGYTETIPLKIALDRIATKLGITTKDFKLKGVDTWDNRLIESILSLNLSAPVGDIYTRKGIYLWLNTTTETKLLVGHGHYLYEIDIDKTNWSVTITSKLNTLYDIFDITEVNNQIYLFTGAQGNVRLYGSTENYLEYSLRKVFILNKITLVTEKTWLTDDHEITKYVAPLTYYYTYRMSTISFNPNLGADGKWIILLNPYKYFDGQMHENPCRQHAIAYFNRDDFLNNQPPTVIYYCWDRFSIGGGVSMPDDRSHYLGGRYAYASHSSGLPDNSSTFASATIISWPTQGLMNNFLWGWGGRAWNCHYHVGLKNCVFYDNASFYTEVQVANVFYRTLSGVVGTNFPFFQNTGSNKYIWFLDGNPAQYFWNAYIDSNGVVKFAKLDAAMTTANLYNMVWYQDHNNKPNFFGIYRSYNVGQAVLNIYSIANQFILFVNLPPLGPDENLRETLNEIATACCCIYDFPDKDTLRFRNRDYFQDDYTLQNNLIAVNPTYRKLEPLKIIVRAGGGSDEYGTEKKSLTIDNEYIPTSIRKDIAYYYWKMFQDYRFIWEFEADFLIFLELFDGLKYNFNDQLFYGHIEKINIEKMLVKLTARMRV